MQVDGKPGMKPGKKPGPSQQLGDIITEQKQLGESMQQMQKAGGKKPGQQGQGQQGQGQGRSKTKTGKGNIAKWENMVMQNNWHGWQSSRHH